MSERRRGLGRGLGALIPTAPSRAGDGVAIADGPTPPAVDHSLVAATGAGLPGRPIIGVYFAEIPIDKITPNPRQPRQIFDEEAHAELVFSVRELGLLQPIVVRQIAPDRFELVMGERRWRACRDAGLDAVPAIVRATDDDRLLLDSLLENLHRTQLNPLEEAAAYDQLLRDFACTHEQLADRIGQSRSQVTNTLRLLRLPPAVQRRVAAGVLSAGHARAVLTIDDPEQQERLASRIVAEGLSVRAVEEIVALGVDEDRPPRRPRAGRRVSPVFDDLATRLANRWDTRVKVHLGKNRGKIVIDFASVDDLDRILEAIAPDARAVLQSLHDATLSDADASNSNASEVT